MSFFEKARVGYENLAGRADNAFDSATASKDLGDIDQQFRDLGMVTYLSATGRDVDPVTQQQLMSVLRSLEQRGAIRDFILQTTGQPPTGTPQPPRPAGSDGIAQPPPERAGRHGDFLSQPRPSVPAPAVMPPPESPAPTEQTWAASDPDETTGPRPTPPAPPSVGGTWGPPPR